MKSVQEYLFRRGKRGTFYVRRRIPLDVADAYPLKKREITRSLERVMHFSLVPAPAPPS